MTVAFVTSRDTGLTDDDALAVAALTGRGVDVAVEVWNDPDVEWGRFGLVVVRSPWDYFKGHRDEFLAWASAVSEVTELQNPADVLRWNTHKGYLMELEERGVPVVPTAFLGRGDTIDLARLLADRRWGEVVVKPVVSAGAVGTFRVAAGGAAGAQADLDALLATGDVMVQPFLEQVATVGEVSVVVLDGAFSHAGRKVPAAGEWRVQEELGGRTEPYDPPREVVDLALWIIEATGQDYLYARVDLLPDENGAWQLTELEVTEPSLYLFLDPDAPGRFAAAIVRRLAAREPA